MNKFVLLPLLCSVLFCNHMIAQPWLNAANNKPVKLDDVVKNYNQNIKPFMIHEDDGDDADQPKEIKENNDYQFDRWRWYWSQHLDANGYLVPSVKTFTEWENYTSKHSINKLTRTTGVNNSDWTFKGPDSFKPGDSANLEQAPGVGRLNVMAFDPKDTNTLFAGSFSGGVWKTTDNGITWKSLTDNLPLLSVSDIIINPKNHNTIYLCTGDGDGNSYYSIGILKSTDGGKTWDTTGLKYSTTDFMFTNSMVINPTDTNTLILAASNGLYRTENGGGKWEKVASGNFTQVLYNPADTNILYATSYYSYSSGTPVNAQIFRSADGGKIWTQITNYTSTIRIALAVTAANPAVVKAVGASSLSANVYALDGIYSSTDTGKTFSKIFTDSSCTRNLLSENQDGSGCFSQGWYDLCIAVSPVDTGKIFLGGVNSWMSADGGYSWQILNQWSAGLAGVIQVHADKHCMRFSPLDHNRLAECNDGGIFMTENPASSAPIYNNITNGLGIGAFYKIAISGKTNKVLGGLQDDGTKSIQDGVYKSVLGGDGMQCRIDNDTNVIYGSYEYGGIERIKYASKFSYSSYISYNIPGTPSGAWVTPYLVHPLLNKYLLAGYQQVYYSSDQGDSWASISSVLGTSSISSLAVSPKDTFTIYAVEQYSGRVHFTHDWSTWNTIVAPYGSYDYISDILVDPKDSNNFYATFSGYDTTVKVAQYSPKGGWKTLNEGLPNVPVNCITMDTTNRVLYIGTDIGAFYRTDSMTEWEPYNTGMPVIRVNDLEINYTTKEIWAATYGRSIWASPKQIFNEHPVDTGESVSIVPFTQSSLSIYPNPNSGSFKITTTNDFSGKYATVVLMDMTGRIVWHSNNTLDNTGSTSINTTGLASGNYIVEVATQNAIIGRKKVIIY